MHLPSIRMTCDPTDCATETSPTPKDLIDGTYTTETKYD